MLGLSIAYLPAGSLQGAAEAFRNLQDEFPLRACELHMEAIQFSAGFWYWDRSVAGTVSGLRGRVDVLGIHLPYLDMNPVSPNPRAARVALAMYRSAIARAASLDADYVAFHARGRRGLDPQREDEIRCWQDVVGSLTDIASERGVALCFENADDVRLLSEAERIVLANPSTMFCLDMGHLFERVELPNRWERIAVRLCDSVWPGLTLVHKGVPLFEADGLRALGGAFRDRIRCIHAHGHDGRSAHRPLDQAQLRIIRTPLDLADIPLVLEVDHRTGDLDAVRRDLMMLKEIAG